MEMSTKMPGLHLLVIDLLVSLRVVASATRGKDGRARPERTPPRREAGKI